jgi:uncharacterized membrane protein YwzB
MFIFILYFVITIIVIWSMDSININSIFKKNTNPLQAKIFYFLLGISMIYLITNFIWDLISSINIL